MHVAWIVLLATVGTLLALVALLGIAGVFLPREHRAVRSLHLRATPPAKVWEAITDHARDAEWRRDVKATARMADHQGRPVWQETYRNGQTMSFETLASVPESRLVRRILEAGGPFGGTWTFELSPEGAGTRLRIAEEGWIANPVFRGMARFVFGYARSLERYLQDLARRFGEPGWPEAA